MLVPDDGLLLPRFPLHAFFFARRRSASSVEVGDLEEWLRRRLCLARRFGLVRCFDLGRRVGAGVTQVFLMTVYVLVCPLHSKSCRMIRTRLALAKLCVFAAFILVSFTDASGGAPLVWSTL